MTHGSKGADVSIIRVTADVECMKEGADASGRAWVHESGGRTHDNDASLSGY